MEIVWPELPSVEWQDVMQFGAVVFATLLVAKGFQLVFSVWLKRRVVKSATKIDDVILESFERPLYWVIFALGMALAVHVLELGDGVTEVVTRVTTVLTIVFGAWSAANFVSVFRKYYIDPITERTETRLDDQIIPIVERALKVIIWSMAALIAFANLGYDIISLLTGLGIGGLAMAMAAQDTLSNVFGSLTIFADRPFQVEDVVTLADQTGTVTDVGLRTCRIRTPEGKLITVPNKVMVGDAIVNHTPDGRRAHVASIGLVYETTSEQLDSAMTALREIIQTTEGTGDVASVNFVAFADSYLEIRVGYHVLEPAHYLATISEVNIAIKKRFDAEGWGMAFPTMTVHRA